MSKKNKKLTDFTKENSLRSTVISSREKVTEGRGVGSKSDRNIAEKDRDESPICDCYRNMYNKYRDELNELEITPPECGSCIEYLCESYTSNRLSENSVSVYNSSLRLFVERLHDRNICIEDVEFVDVRQFFDYRGKMKRSKSCLYTDRSAIKGVISNIEANTRSFPVVSWKIKENIKPSTYAVDRGFDREPLKDKGINKLLTASDDLRNQLIILTGMELGPRSKALLLIKVSDVDLEKKTVELKNTKTGGSYIMPLTDHLSDILEHWIINVRSSYIQDEDNEFLFPSRTGGRLARASLIEIVDATAVEAGIQERIAKIPITERQKELLNIEKDYKSKNRVDVHVLRHTFSWLLKKYDISKEARIYALDHTPDVTDHYGIDEERCRKEIRNKFEGVDISAL